jgi:glycosyltransferase involved in cell wall biosynthesis
MRFHVLQFTWGDQKVSERIAIACAAAGVSYARVTVWRSGGGLGPFLSAIKGAWHVRSAIRQHRIDLVMPRSTMPALSCLIAARDPSTRFVFDADGLPLDERVDFAGLSASSVTYRLLRDVEAQAIRLADVVLTRSIKAVDILHARAGAGTVLGKFHVVTNGRDAEIFKPSDAEQSALTRRELGLSAGAPLLVYAGSLGAQYCMEEMLRVFALIRERRPDAHWLILTGSPEAVQPALGRHPQLQGNITTRKVSPQTVPQYLACADLGLALRQPSFSMQAVAPIKLGEYLLCGLPVLATADIGDTDAITVEVGCLLHRMDEVALQAAANWFVDSVLPTREAYRSSCRAAGLNRFSLEASASFYRNAFESLKGAA